MSKLTDINEIFVRGRQPMFMPRPLSEWLRQMCLNSNVIELYGPSTVKNILEVYGYYVPALHCILEPKDMRQEGLDLDMMETQLGSYSDVRDYILVFVDTICDKMRDYCNLRKDDCNAIINQHYDMTDENYYRLIYERALRSDCRTVAKYFITRNSEYILWKEIWEVFQIDKYDLWNDENHIVETEFFIIYLHLPLYETDHENKVIFSTYCNKVSGKEMSYVMLSEANEKKENVRLRVDYCHKLLSPSEYRYRLDLKPVLKFDGVYYQVPAGEGFFGSNSRFGYKFDGIYKVTGTDQSGNYVLEPID